jgi:hypothetical protein
MTDENRENGVELASAKRRWSEPKIESVEGREARANFANYGGVDSGIYS